MEENSGQTAPRTEAKVKMQKTQFPPDHPYREYEGTPRWRLVNKAIDALVKNGDLEERTNRAYITGYICRVLSAAEHASRPPRRREKSKSPTQKSQLSPPRKALRKQEVANAKRGGSPR